MDPKSKLPAPCASHRLAPNLDEVQVTWEYRFADVDESISTLQGTTAGGWIVVSSSTRGDKRREYLLKRRRR